MWLVHCCFANFLWWLFSLGSCYLCWSLWFWKFLMLIVVVRVVVLSVLDTVGCCLLATSICVWGLHLSSPLWLFFLALVLCWLLSFLCWLFWHSTICVRGLHLPSPLCASGRQPGQHSQKEQSTFQPEVFLYLLQLTSSGLANQWGAFFSVTRNKYLWTQVTNLTIHINANHGVLLKL